MENWTVHEEMAAYVIGRIVMAYLKDEETLKKIALGTETHAIKALADVQRALNDDSLDDPNCFYRIDAIIRALEDNGMCTSRHDF